MVQGGKAPQPPHGHQNWFCPLHPVSSFCNTYRMADWLQHSPIFDKLSVFARFPFLSRHGMRSLLSSLTCSNHLETAKRFFYWLELWNKSQFRTRRKISIFQKRHDCLQQCPKLIFLRSVFPSYIKVRHADVSWYWNDPVVHGDVISMLENRQCRSVAMDSLFCDHFLWEE